jgi:hypothetical protein
VLVAKLDELPPITSVQGALPSGDDCHWYVSPEPKEIPLALKLKDAFGQPTDDDIEAVPAFGVPEQGTDGINVTKPMKPRGVNVAAAIVPPYP